MFWFSEQSTDILIAATFTFGCRFFLRGCQPSRKLSAVTMMMCAHLDIEYSPLSFLALVISKVVLNFRTVGKFHWTTSRWYYHESFCYNRAIVVGLKPLFSVPRVNRIVSVRCTLHPEWWWFNSQVLQVIQKHQKQLQALGHCTSLTEWIIFHRNDAGKKTCYSFPLKVWSKEQLQRAAWPRHISQLLSATLSSLIVNWLDMKFFGLQASNSFFQCEKYLASVGNLSGCLWLLRTVNSWIH